MKYIAPVAKAIAAAAAAFGAAFVVAAADNGVSSGEWVTIAVATVVAAAAVWAIPNKPVATE
jgi:hypothetical protein